MSLPQLLLDGAIYALAASLYLMLVLADPRLAHLLHLDAPFPGHPRHRGRGGLPRLCLSHPRVFGR